MFCGFVGVEFLGRFWVIGIFYFIDYSCEEDGGFLDVVFLGFFLDSFMLVVVVFFNIYIFWVLWFLISIIG